MPWIHLEWDQTGGMKNMVMTDDDAEPIAECVAIHYRQDSPRGALEMSMDFIIPDRDKFNEATMHVPKDDAQLKHKSGEIKEIPDVSWDEAKWDQLSWRKYYDEIQHDLDGYSRGDLLEECEWFGMTNYKTLNKGELKKLLLEHYADEQYDKAKRRPRKKSKVKS